jgi:hypothetical protein
MRLATKAIASASVVSSPGPPGWPALDADVIRDAGFDPGGMGQRCQAIRPCRRSALDDTLACEMNEHAPTQRTEMVDDG